MALDPEGATREDVTPLSGVSPFAGRPHYFGRGEHKMMRHLRDLRPRAHGGE
jgi:hypothetical protein